MNPENYRPCGARLSQGDIVRAPIGVFARLADLGDRAVVDEAGLALELGDLRGIASSVSRLMVSSSPVVLRAWYLPAVVVSPDCDLDKRPPQLLVAPIFPLGAYTKETQDAIKAGRLVAAFDLPSDEELELADRSRTPFPRSVVALRQVTAVSPALVETERMVALSDAQIERLHNAWVRFVALREISSTGTIAALAGRRIARVSTVESSRRRHTVLLTLDDGSLVVVYQEPRSPGPQLQSVRVRDGRFTPESVQALTGSELVLRFENEDPRDWLVSCRALDLAPWRLAAAATSECLIKCPAKPLEAVLVNDQKRAERLTLRIVAVGESSGSPASPG